MTDTTDYGADADWDAYGPLSAMFPWTTGSRAVALCLSRKLSIPTGSIEYMPNTVSLTSFLESNKSNRYIQSAVERVVASEERIDQYAVRVSRIDETVSVRIAARLATGVAFSMVMSATAASVSPLLFQEAA